MAFREDQIVDWFPKPALELEQVVLNEINWHAHPFKVIADDPWLLIYSPPPPPPPNLFPFKALQRLNMSADIPLRSKGSWDYKEAVRTEGEHRGLSGGFQEPLG